MGIVGFEHIKTRTPIIERVGKSVKEIEREWKLVTEAIRREVIKNGKTRKEVADFVDTPVSETLPGEFLKHLHNQRIGKLRDRFKGILGSYLDLEAVPDELISPDIKHAKTHTDLAEKIAFERDEMERKGEGLRERIEDLGSLGAFDKGITHAERIMIAQRYSFARDVKMLALSAELIQEEENVRSTTGREIELPSGILISLNTDDPAKREELLKPHRWKKRVQSKDRVYKVDVGESKYILKEKKTARHAHTKKRGHQPGLSSLEEFKVAQHFEKNEGIDKEEIKLSWEKPVAVVTYPDGFQFTVFEYEEDLIENEEVAKEEFIAEVTNHKKEYEKEYQKVKELAKRYLNDERVKKALRIREPGRLGKFFALLKRTPELTFEDYVRIKYKRVRKRAGKLMEKAIFENGRQNTDTHGVAFKVNKREAGPQLELFIYDFEYFEKLNLTKDEIEKKRKQRKEAELYFELNHDLGSTLSPNRKHRHINAAAYLAMLILEGVIEEEIKEETKK